MTVTQTVACTYKQDRIVNTAAFTIVEDDDLGSLNLKITKFNIPSDGVAVVKHSNPFNNNSEFYGDTRTNGELLLTFIVDSDLDNLFKLKEWLNTIKDRSQIRNTELTKTGSLDTYDNDNIKMYSISYNELRLIDVGEVVIVVGENVVVQKCDLRFHYLNYKHTSYSQ